MNRPTASERRTVALAALSIPPRLLGWTMSLVREAAALATTEAEIAPGHTLWEGCGCDLCRAAREELDAVADARRDAWMDALDADASLPWDRDLTLDDVGLPLLAHAVCDGGLPSNAAVDPGEAA